jgi:hypothetical protein
MFPDDRLRREASPHGWLETKRGLTSGWLPYEFGQGIFFATMLGVLLFSNVSLVINPTVREDPTGERSEVVVPII